VFSVEVKFKVEGKEVTPQRLAELLLLEVLRSAREQLQLNSVAAASAPTAAKEDPSSRAPEPKVVSIQEAARLVGLRPSTIRKYVAMGKIAFVRIGRRVLIPKEGIDELIRRGLQPAR
jgi:excisionase family DNA binding protein